MTSTLFELYASILVITENLALLEEYKENGSQRKVQVMARLIMEKIEVQHERLRKLNAEMTGLLLIINQNKKEE